MAKSTPIQQLPVDIIDDIKDEDDNINKVLEEIEQQNTIESYTQPLNNNIPVSFINKQNTQEYQPQQPQYQPQIPMNQFSNNNSQITQDEIRKLLSYKQQSTSYSLENLWNIFKTEIKLCISIFIVFLLLQNLKFNEIIENNFNFISIPYFNSLMKSCIATIIVILIKKLIS
jgi:predicted PurR-regulated permease PerM